MAKVKAGSTQAGARSSQSDEPTSAFPEKSTSVFLMVIKRLHVFAAMEQLTDGD
jgi:hypothetical protein